MRARRLLVGFLCVALLQSAAQTQDAVPAPPVAESHLSIEVRGTSVELSGVVSSAAHESILHKTAIDHFAGKTPEFNLQVRPALPPGWALTTEITLRSLASTRTASVEISNAGIVVKGITASAAEWARAAARIADNLLPGMTFSHQVIEIRSPGSMNRQCLELFRTAMRGRKIEFSQSSATLRTSTAPLLDELVQIAADCPAATIEITGHTDTTGHETTNETLSQQRADAVAAYMVAGGINVKRLSAAGAGSSRPLVAEKSPQARQLNRRIDIEMKFPDT
jgi:OOP family OmpA-OmpF porin